MFNTYTIYKLPQNVTNSAHHIVHQVDNVYHDYTVHHMR